MPAVRAKHGLPAKKAPRDGQRRIQQRNGQRNQGAVIPSTVADFWDQTTPKHPSRKPTVILPQSPMKMDAGLKL
jgi:hypothetical protein